MGGVIRGPGPIMGVAVLVVTACGGSDETKAGAARTAQAPAVVVTAARSESVPIYRDFVARTAA